MTFSQRAGRGQVAFGEEEGGGFRKGMARARSLDRIDVCADFELSETAGAHRQFGRVLVAEWGATSRKSPGLSPLSNQTGLSNGSIKRVNQTG